MMIANSPEPSMKVEEDIDVEYVYNEPRYSNATVLSETVMNDVVEQSKTQPRVSSNFKTLAIILALIIGLTVAVISIIVATSSFKESFVTLDSTTLPYNVTATTVQITSTSEGNICGSQNWISDGQCDDEANNIECQYDGGDCCLPSPIFSFCYICVCHLANESRIQEDLERVLVIIGGKSADNQNTEVIYESQKVDHYLLPAYPKNRIGTCSGLIEDQIIIVCGGMEEYSPWFSDVDWSTVSAECYTIGNTTDLTWQLYISMRRPRTYAAAIVIDRKLWITGGDTGGDGIVEDVKSEFLDPKDPNVLLEGPDMPYGYIAKHCLTLISQHQVMLIGGETLDDNDHWIFPRETFVYDFLIELWRNGPNIATGRIALGCSQFTDKNKVNWTIISGGLDEDGARLKTTEMLADVSSEWISGEII